MTRPARIGGVSTNLALCAALGSGPEGARGAIDALLGVGGEFLYGRDPFSRIDADGNVLGILEVRHPSLRMDGIFENALRSPHPGSAEATIAQGPTASLSYLSDERWVRIRQDGNMESFRRLDEMVLGQLLLACDLVPRLRPGYGWIDEAGDNRPDLGALRPGAPEYLFWANYFGPEHADALGRDFLAKAPGWRLVDFPDGGLLYVATPSFAEWRYEGAADIEAYFRQRVPGIRLYRAEKHPEYGDDYPEG